MMASPTTTDMLAALRETHHNLPHRESWAYFEELRVGTGFGHGSQQSIDAFAIALWPREEHADLDCGPCGCTADLLLFMEGR